MKKVILGLIFAAAVVGIGIYSAIDLGEKSPVYASGKIVLPSEHAKAALGIKTLYLVVYDLDSPMPMPYGPHRSVDVFGRWFSVRRVRTLRGRKGWVA